LASIFDNPDTKNKKVLPILLIALFCVAVNLYWFFHQDNNADFFIQLNLFAAFTLMLSILYQAIRQQFKNGKKNKIK
jgi:hypothetical protein